MLLYAGTETNSNYRTAGRRLGRNLISLGQRQRKSGKVDSEHTYHAESEVSNYVRKGSLNKPFGVLQFRIDSQMSKIQARDPYKMFTIQIKF